MNRTLPLFIIRLLTLCVLAALSTPALLAEALVVTNTNGSGPGSLRDAVVLADATPGVDAVVFAAPLVAGDVIDLGADLALADVVLDTTLGAGAVDVAVNAGTLSFRGGSAWTGGGKILLGAASGSADATVEVKLSHNSTLAVPITVRAGSSGVKKIRAASLGINSFSGAITLRAPATVERVNVSGADPIRFTGGLDLGGNTLTVEANEQVLFDCPVGRFDGTGVAQLVKNGNSYCYLRHSSDNPRLTATVNAGVLFLDKTTSASVHALGSGLPAGTTALTVASGALVTFGVSGNGSDQIADTASATVNGALYLYANEILDALNGSGTVNSMSSTLTVGAGNSSGSFTANSGNGSLILTKIGTGTQTVAGSGVSGELLLSGGTLNVTGDLSGASHTIVQSGATLAGTGTVWDLALQSGSFFAPGDATVAGSIGTLNSPVTAWNGGATARFHLSNTDNTSDRLAAYLFAKGSAGTFAFNFQGTGKRGTTYTLATFTTNSGFAAGDFTYTNLASGLTGVFTLSATSLTFTTTNTLVTITADGGAGSLRQAIANAAAVPGADTIAFAPGFTGAIPLASEIVLASDVTIDASSIAGGVTVDGGATSHRLFFVNSGQTVSLKNLTLTRGRGPLGFDFGGAIRSSGALTLTHCTLSDNAVTFGGSGGAISTSGGTLTLDCCTLSGNSVAGMYGGAIYTNDTAVTLTHCTFAGNSITNGNGSAISLTGGTLAATHCTVSGNVCNGGVSVIYNQIGGSTIALNHCLVAGNTPNDINGSFTGANNLTGGDPLLAPLGNYGGPTQTMALLPGSHARNAAVGSIITSDQRGFPIVGTPDIGAYEAGTSNSFATWTWETAGGAISPGVDHEGDGANALLEYALRRDPFVSDVTLAPTLTGPAGSRTFTFRYQAAARDLRYIVQRNTDLNNAAAWADIYRFNTSTGVIDELLSVTGDENAGTQIITLTDPVPGSQQFWRLRIEQLP